MLSEFEMKKLKLEIIRVSAAKSELEFKIDERLEDIKRIKENIEVQEKRLKELEQKLLNKEN